MKTTNQKPDKIKTPNESGVITNPDWEYIVKRKYDYIRIAVERVREGWVVGYDIELGIPGHVGRCGCSGYPSTFRIFPDKHKAYMYILNELLEMPELSKYHKQIRKFKWEKMQNKLFDL